jgi:hypothetical protein
MSETSKNLVAAFSTDIVASREAAGAMRQAAQAISGAAGGNFLRYDEDGWMIGADQQPQEEGAQWVINPTSMKHGWIRFHESKKTGEVSGSVFAEKPAVPNDGQPGGWGDFVSADLACINGEDFGEQATLSGGQVGFLSAIKPIMEKIAMHLEQGRIDVFPVVELATSTYENKKYKRPVAVPIISIVRWLSEPELNEHFNSGGGTVIVKDDAFPAAGQEASEPVKEPSPAPVEEAASVADGEQANADAPKPRRRQRSRAA